MRSAAIVLATTSSVGFFVAAGLILGWGRASLLAPVIVLTAAALVALLLLWGRVAWESLRGSPHRGRILAVALGAIGVLVALSILGIELPRE